MRTMKRWSGLVLLAASISSQAQGQTRDPTDPTPQTSPQQSGPGSAGDSTGQGAGSSVGPDGTPLGNSTDPAGSGAFNNASGGGFGANQGGFAGSGGAPPAMIGDFPPISQARASTRFPNLPTPLPAPTNGRGNPGIVSANGTTSILFKLTGLKISDNQSPLPQDRVFSSFNYFDNLNASVNKRLGSPVQNLQVYHELFGIEKTIFEGRGSIGFRMPLNTISFKSTANIAGFGGSTTAPGDLSVFFKYVLFSDQKGSLISGGLQVTAPTGPGAFGGNKYYSYFRDTQIQPFVGYLFSRDRFYLQGFTAVNVPTMSQDVTLLFTDVGIGYYAYRSNDANRFLTAIVPTAEAHLTTPLNHRGFNFNDLASTPDILNMTVGTNLEFQRRTILTVAYVTPVTGPKPFNAELVLLLNVKFGRSVRSPLPGIPTQ